MPLATDWTIGDLLDWLALDDAPAADDRALGEALRTLELSLARGAGAPAWRREPSTVALVRSIAAFVRDDPSLRGARLAGIDASAAEVLRERVERGPLSLHEPLTRDPERRPLRPVDLRELPHPA